MISKNINSINVNDYVLSFNTVTNTYEYKKVKRVLNNGKRELLKITLANQHEIKLTPDHKVLTSDGYIDAKYANDVLCNDDFIPIIDKEYIENETVYDIEVEDNHNFCVQNKKSFKSFAVVHNCGAQVPFS